MLASASLKRRACPLSFRFPSRFYTLAARTRWSGVSHRFVHDGYHRRDDGGVTGPVSEGWAMGGPAMQADATAFDQRMNCTTRRTRHVG